MNVTIPESMKVSTSVDERYPDPSQIVWWGDPPGDRKEQVIALMTDAVRDGASQALKGSRPVNVNLTIDQFHAMSPRALTTDLQLGVHEILFDIWVTDAANGQTLAQEQNVSSDIRAYSGTKAVIAEQQGETQKVRIKRRVSEVIAAWLSK